MCPSLSELARRYASHATHTRTEILPLALQLYLHLHRQYHSTGCFIQVRCAAVRASVSTRITPRAAPAAAAEAVPPGRRTRLNRNTRRTGDSEEEDGTPAAQGWSIN